ncbi:hypothetical protein FB451DRAFT_1400721 [Mycena latifolia]|nr:hypothetical protein FB451DRAFT_1400721 [Mycena latifolia]
MIQPSLRIYALTPLKEEEDILLNMPSEADWEDKRAQTAARTNRHRPLRLVPTATKALGAPVPQRPLVAARLAPCLPSFSSSYIASLSLAEERAPALEAWHEARMPVGVHPLRHNTLPLLPRDPDARATRCARPSARRMTSGCVDHALLTYPSISSPSLGPLRAHIPPRCERALTPPQIWVISRFVKPASSSKRPKTAANANPANPLVATLKTPATPLLETPSASIPFMLGG